MKDTQLHIIGAKPYEEVRDLCHNAKIEVPELVNNIGASFLPVLPSHALLIPVPGHDGSATHTLRLAAAIAAKSIMVNRDAEKFGDTKNNKYVYPFDCLKCNPHVSFCERKRSGEDISKDELKVEFKNEYSLTDKEIISRNLQLGYKFVLVDNVVDTGKTVRSCMKALEPYINKEDILVLAIGDTGRHRNQEPK